MGRRSGPSQQVRGKLAPHFRRLIFLTVYVAAAFCRAAQSSLDHPAKLADHIPAILVRNLHPFRMLEFGLT